MAVQQKRLFRVEMLKSDEPNENGTFKAVDVQIAADGIMQALQRGEEICKEHGWLKTVLIEQKAVIEVV